jgi:hypothetical protein
MTGRPDNDIIPISDPLRALVQSLVLQAHMTSCLARDLDESVSPRNCPRYRC